MKITVTGVSQVKLPAECAVISVAASATSPQSDDALAMAAKSAESLRTRLDSAVDAGSARKVEISALRTWTSTGFDAEGNPGTPQHSAEVRGTFTVDDAAAVGPLVGELAAIDGVAIQAINWQLSEETIALQQPEVIGEAFRQARRRAGWIAAAAGYRGINATSVRDDGAPMFARAASPMMARGGAPQFDLDPAEVEVSAHLSVDFEAS